MAAEGSLLENCTFTITVLFLFCLCTGEGQSIKKGWLGLEVVPEGPIQYHGAASINDEVYLLGGIGANHEVLKTVYAYNITSGKWTKKSPLPISLHRPNVAAVGGRLYVLGALLPHFSPTERCWMYDPTLDRWAELAAMGEDQARGAAAVGVFGSQIVVAGGFQDFMAVGLTSSYDTVSGNWTHGLAEMSHPRDHALGLSVGKDLYVFGGRNGTLVTASRLIQIYHPAIDIWEVGKELVSERAGLGGALVGNTIVLMGGEGVARKSNQTRLQITGSVEVCSRRSMKCREKGKMLFPRHGMSVVKHKRLLYVTGGANLTLFGPIRAHNAFLPP